jgi:hypothetical protein
MADSRESFDYAKIDYVLREGSVVLLGINRTPSTSTLDRLRLTAEVTHRLVEGIRELLRPPPWHNATLIHLSAAAAVRLGPGNDSAARRELTRGVLFFSFRRTARTITV